MKGRVSIIGGGGRVGSSAAYALQLGGVGDEIVLVDLDADAARGEALDLTHGRAAAAGPRFTSGDYEAVTGSDVVVVTAGLRRRPDESRLKLIERNAALFGEILRSVQAVELAPEPILLVVTNPVDVLTYVAATDLGWPPKQTIGLGTMLDSLRFRSLLGERLGVDPSLIDGLILGEHGDSMVPVVSQLRFDGKPISAVPGYSESAVQEAVEATRTAGAQCLRLKGGAGYAVGVAVRDVVAAILSDSDTALPVSTVDESGEFQGVALSRPTRLGRSGWRERLSLPLSEEEHRSLLQSAEVLRETIARLQAGASAAEKGGQP